MNWTIRLSDLYLIKKERLSIALLYAGMLLAFLGSLRAWFLWPLGNYYLLPPALLIITSILLARSMERDTIYTRTNYLVPLGALILFVIYERLSLGSNLNGYIGQSLLVVVFYAFFCLDLQRLKQLADFICRAMAVLLAISLAGHFLYLLGFPLPGRDVEYDEFYSFVNYNLFLLDDRNLFVFVPRFNSYFLEPSHIGQACAFMLMTQRGRWKRWYNIVLLTTIFFTFSVGAYVYLVAIAFFNQWISRKHVAGKVLLIISFIAVVTVVSFTYNGGDNLVNNLIMLRLEVDDGELAGDNRVTENFMADYKNYIESSDIVFGRSFEIVEFGNAGYRVFFYEHGLIGVLLIFLLYVLSLMYTPNKRAFVAVLVVVALYFWATAFMTWVYVYLPLYAAAYSEANSEGRNDS